MDYRHIQTFIYATAARPPTPVATLAFCVVFCCIKLCSLFAAIVFSFSKYSFAVPVHIYFEIPLAQRSSL